MYASQSNLDSSLMRHLWSIIETNQSDRLLQLNDKDLVRQLLKQLCDEIYLAPEQIHPLKAYILARTTLIRDLARSRQSSYIFA